MISMQKDWKVLKIIKFNYIVYIGNDNETS